MFIEITNISNEAQEKLIKARQNNSQINQFMKKKKVGKGSQTFPV